MSTLWDVHADAAHVDLAGQRPHPYCSWGALDPRIAYRPRTKEYYLTWDNCTFECAFRSSLLSVSKDPFDHSSWTLVGPVIPGMQTAGVSLLFLDAAADGPDVAAGNGAATAAAVAGTGAAKHLAFVSTYNCFTIALAESVDGRQWDITNPTWMQGRPGCWDVSSRARCGSSRGWQ